MNFKRYHESKNLFDESTAVFGKYIDSNGVEQTSTTGENNHSDYIPVKSGVQYTLAETKPSYSGIVSAIAWYTSAKVFIQRDSATLPSLAGRTSNTWTAPSNASYAIINFYRYQNFENENDMLNEGSTALPYEPYSSEVWHDISSYKQAAGSWITGTAYERSGGSWT